jgi:hypothetical protein
MSSGPGDAEKATIIASTCIERVTANVLSKPRGYYPITDRGYKPEGLAGGFLTSSRASFRRIFGLYENSQGADGNR